MGVGGLEAYVNISRVIYSHLKFECGEGSRSVYLDIIAMFGFNCQGQVPTLGPTLGPTQGQGHGQVMVRSGQVRSNSNSNSNSKVGPELYTKIGFHHPPLTHHTISQ